MGYERNDRRYGGSSSNDRVYDGDRTRPPGNSGYQGGRGDVRDERADQFGYQSSGRGYGEQRGADDRGFLDRAGDEVRSWFGDEDAERRRRADDRDQQRDVSRPSYDSRHGGYGSDRGGGPDRGAETGRATANDRQDVHRDEGYRSWRDRQIAAFDNDYDEYRREHQSKFDAEFHGWRQNRQGQRDMLGKVREHQEVIGSDGQHIGTVDHVRDDRIKLTKTDKDAGGHHHTIPSSWIESVDDKVTVSKTADQAKAHWKDEERNGAGLFGGGDDTGGNARNLNRSFSGTY